MQQLHRPVRQPHGARASDRRARSTSMSMSALVAAVAVPAVVSLAGCRIEGRGLHGSVNADAAITPPAPARADAASVDASAAAPNVDARTDAVVAPDAAGPPMVPMPMPMPADTNTPPPPPLPDASGTPDVGVTPRPDAAPEASTPPPPPPNADPCAPSGDASLPVSVRVRSGEPAVDFAFSATLGFVILDRDGTAYSVDNNGRFELLTRNLTSRTGRLRGLTDGDLLVLDSSRNQLSRIDPSLRRPERFPMFVRQPLQLAPAGTATPSLFFVTTEQGQIYRANADTGELTMLVDLGNLTLGGLAVDSARRKLYVGVGGLNGALHALDIGANGQLSGFVKVADNTPYPTALAIDSCGGVYIAGSPGGALRRRAPTGAVSMVSRLDASDVVTLEFGPGRQGWSDQSLFALDGPTGVVYEVRLRN